MRRRWAMQVIVVAHGRGTLSGPGGSCELGPGDAVLMPAGAAPQECWPEGDSLKLLQACRELPLDWLTIPALR